MAKIAVKFFGPLSQMVGTEQVSLELAEPALGAGLLEQLERQYRSLLPSRERLMLLVNRDYATTETVLGDGDRVVVVPLMGCCH